MIVPLLATLALAKPLSLHPSHDATVVVLPRTQPDFIELGVYHNTAPIGVEVRTWREPSLVLARTVDAGGGTQFVVLEVDPHIIAELTRSGDVVTVTLRPGEPQVLESAPIPTIDELFDGLPRGMAPEPKIALTPLLRDARTYRLPSSAIHLDVDDPGRVPPVGWEALDLVEAPTLADVERWRLLLPSLEDGRLLNLAYWRLGSAHHSLGMHREAAYYFSRGEGVGFPPAAMFLRHADSAMQFGDHEQARAACQQAWYRDADPERVLECLGALSLATGLPAPSQTGRALARVADTPTGELLAGELLLRDGFAEEAIAPLQSAVAKTMGPNQAFARLALGDAWLVLGEVDRAQEAYLTAPHDALAPILEVREVMVRMLRDGVRRWPAWVPELHALAAGGGPAGADALYLLAQVHERYVDWEAAAGTLVQLWDTYPEVHDSDVGARLLDDCGRRIAELDRDRRDAELVAVFDSCWRDELASHVSDVALLASASLAWERLGLADEALEVQLDLTTVLAAAGQEDPLALGRLAHLQVVTHNPDRALETVAYARALAPGDVGLGRRLDFAAAEAHAALDQVDAAVSAYRSAASEPALFEEATRELGVLQLRTGRCEDALAILMSRLSAGPLEGQPPGELELMAVRCAVELNRPKEAITAAGLAVARATDAWTPVEAKWLATAIALRSGATLPDALRSDAPTLSALSREDGNHAAFLAQIEVWRTGSR